MQQGNLPKSKKYTTPRVYDSRHFFGGGQTVKQYSRACILTLIATEPSRMRIVSQVNGSRGKIRCGQAVKAIFRRSKILTPVAALYTVPMGVTPPPPCYEYNLQPTTPFHQLHPHTAWPRPPNHWPRPL